MSPPPVDRWTAVLRPASRLGGRLVVFPHAGAGTERYATLVSELPDDVEVVGVTLPGRERRAGLPPCLSTAEAVGAVDAELGALTPVPTVFFGHSMGALLAVATAHRGGARCDGLVVSCSVPGARGLRLPGRPDGRDEWAAVLAAHRLPADALENPALNDAQRVLAHDLALTRDALRAVGGGPCPPAPLTVPLTALAGRDDPLVDPAVLPLWGHFTSGPFRARLADGGHFFPFTPYGRALLSEELRELHARRLPEPLPGSGAFQ
ncbi:thioesterase II family protein [Streptomyces sp. TRM49041]|uniref:thioesterase II family protein n=1 Tax=Streptomyces sp. TRM49041 TaxID=2603216 RepID=UPI0011EBFB92|nr:alpha/beta fold hydrolase [Streptomyces sp. TRM49041]